VSLDVRRLEWDRFHSTSVDRPHEGLRMNNRYNWSTLGCRYRFGLFTDAATASARTQIVGHRNVHEGGKVASEQKAIARV
jgi:hypothetical protein